jgi:hypothetical protein
MSFAERGHITKIMRWLLPYSAEPLLVPDEQRASAHLLHNTHVVLSCRSSVPAVYVLPFTSHVTPGTTHLLMFNCDNGAIMRLTSNNTWSQYRDIPSSLWPTPNF